MNVREYQMWLNQRGATLTVDGIGGPATRSATLTAFVNTRAMAITPLQIEAIAQRLGGTAKQVRAIAKVESAGGGWDNAGRLKCLYERHYAWKRLRILIPILSNPSAGGYTTDADRDGINDSWEKVADMACRNPLVAFESASWGKFQIMGAWAAKLGYGNAIDFAWALSRAESEHYEALADYIERFGLVPAFRALSTNPDDCRAFAKGYNGSRYAKGSYHLKLAAAMR